MKINRMTKYTAISTIISLIMRGLGLGFSVFLTRKKGSEGIGLMTLITSVYALGVSFSAAGYRLATTRLAVEDENSKSPDALTLILKILTLALITGTLAAFFMRMGSEFIAVNILKEPRSAQALKTLSVSLPFLALSGVLCAYLGAFYKVVKIGIVQGVSQICQIIYVALSLKEGFLVEECCNKIAVGSVLGEFAALLIAVFFVFSQIKNKKRVRSNKKFFAPFIRIALPDALGYELRSALSTIQQLLVPIGFRKSGASASVALSVYGIMHGMALQIVLFPSCILRSLSSLLVPVITESRSLGNELKTKTTIRRVLHMTLAFSFMISSIMFFCADALAIALYNTPECAAFLRLFSPLIPIMYLDICADSMLKGLDKQVASMGYNLLDSIVSVVMVYFLIPKYQVTGYVIMVFFTETMNTLLSVWKLIKVSNVGLSPYYDIVNPIICALGAGAICFFVTKTIPNTPIGLVIKLLFNILTYVSLMLMSSPETKENLFSMFGIRHKAIS